MPRADMTGIESVWDEITAAMEAAASHKKLEFREFLRIRDLYQKFKILAEFEPDLQDEEMAEVRRTMSAFDEFLKETEDIFAKLLD